MKLKQITLKEARKRKLNKLGEAFGGSVNHCIYLGSKYCKDFDKAGYYVVKIGIKSDKKLLSGSNELMFVEFYENRVEK